MTPDDEPILSDQTKDDTDHGWSEQPDEDDDLRRLVDDMPPHHLDRD